MLTFLFFTNFVCAAVADVQYQRLELPFALTPPVGHPCEMVGLSVLASLRVEFLRHRSVSCVVCALLTRERVHSRNALYIHIQFQSRRRFAQH